jgi:hypothetical protein
LIVPLNTHKTLLYSRCIGVSYEVDIWPQEWFAEPNSNLGLQPCRKDLALVTGSSGKGWHGALNRVIQSASI